MKPTALRSLLEEPVMQGNRAYCQLALALVAKSTHTNDSSTVNNNNKKPTKTKQSPPKTTNPSLLSEGGLLPQPSRQSSLEPRGRGEESPAPGQRLERSRENDFTSLPGLKSRDPP